MKELLEISKLLISLNCINATDEPIYKTLEYRSPANSLRHQADKLEKCDECIKKFKKLVAELEGKNP